MKLAPSGSYEKIEQGSLGDRVVAAWISRRREDTYWDTFLQETPLGQFQQSTIWAQAKDTEGWKPLLVVLTVDGEIVGGFQILWHRSWRGRIGYVSKGPVVLLGYPGLAEYATELLQKLARRERLRALVIQPPDLCRQMSARLAGSGFLLDVLGGVNEATWIIDLRNGFEAVERGMGKETRAKARRAAGRGLRIREGGKQDLGTFFDLMRSTCRRQGVRPNPSDVRSLLALWDAAHLTACARLFFADYEGIPIAGHICVVFGHTVTFWKRGWNLTEGKRYPNDFLAYEGLKWASSSGYQFADFCAFDERMAVAMMRREPLTREQMRSRYLFITRLGGSPRLLPEARVYFPNPLFRLAYRLMFCKKIRQAEENCRLAEQAAESPGSR
jgi:hypothetical protein